MSKPRRTIQVLLDADYFDESLEKIIGAICMIKGVAEAKPGSRQYSNSYVARSVARRELIDELLNVLHPKGE